MLSELFQKANKSLQTCCSGAKSYLLTRHLFDAEDAGEKRTECKIFCDLSDQRTFFAWQRNHMANERTFLSWCRTGIALIAFGFVIERFDILIREMRIVARNPETAHIHGTNFLSLTAFALGALIIVLAGWRFFYLRRHINKGETEFSIIPDIFLLGSVLITIGTAFAFFVFFF